MAVKRRSSARSSKPRPRAESAPQVDSSIVVVRGQRVILAADLAAIYGVATKALTQAVRRNADRFPPDFVFRLTLDEARRVPRSRSQSVTLNEGPSRSPEILRSQSVTLGWGTYSKYAPLAFTEHGAVMAASVLNSPRAVEMSIFVVRAFLRLRQLVAGQAELAVQLERLERRVTGHDRDLKDILAALRRLMAPPPEPPRPRIGFAPRDA